MERCGSAYRASAERRSSITAAKCLSCMASATDWPARMRDNGRDERRRHTALRVGVIGGGQLAWMMIAPAVELGLDIRVPPEGEGVVRYSVG